MKSISTITAVILVAIAGIAALIYSRADDDTEKLVVESKCDSTFTTSPGFTQPDRPPYDISETKAPTYLVDNFNTDLSKSDVDWGEVLSGGPPKDGIPSIDNPKFIPITETDIAGDTEGLLLEINDCKRFYPYNILVRHEIVNDVLNGQAVAVTFCPLCGSGIVFDRTVNGKVTEFGVSGSLRESNMIMYDRTTESLWQQATGEVLAGTLFDTKLEYLPVQLSTVKNVSSDHPDAQILSLETGIYPASTYFGTPYGDYDENDIFIFRPSNIDDRYPSKEVFQIVPVGDYSVAIRRDNLETNNEYTYEGEANIDLTISVDDSGLITPLGPKGEEYPTYFEMWFSWAVQHENDENAIAWEPQR